MGITQYYVASSIDGFLAKDDGGLDWLLQFEGFQGQAADYQEFLRGVGAIVMGADTYRFLLDQMPESWPYPGLPSWVFSHRKLPRYPGEDIRFVSGPVEKATVEKIAQTATELAGERNVWLLGGSKLAAQFQEAGLIDELVLTVVPVILGSGRPLLPMGRPTSVLELLGQRQFGSGIVQLRYRIRPTE